MTNRSNRPRPIDSIRHRILRLGALVSFLAGTLAVAFGAPIAVSAAGSTSVGSSPEPRAFQHSSADKVAYLHDGSLLVGYSDLIGPGHAIINHVTSPSTTPVSTLAESITAGSEVTFYTLPSTNSTEIWVGVGSELTGGTKQEQVQYGTYNGTTFTWGAITTVPGSLTSGRQDPSITWTGTYLIVSWWDDTLGANSDQVFYNWTATKDGTGGWNVVAKSGTTATAAAIKSGTSSPVTLAAATSIDYNPTSGGAPTTSDVFEFGHGTANSDVRAVGAVVQKTGTTAAATAALATSITYTVTAGPAPAIGDVYQFGTGTLTAETRTLTNVVGTVSPFTLTVAAFTNPHAMSEIDTGPYALTVSALTHPHAVGEAVTTGASAAGATTILYNTSGAAPLNGDMFQIGTAISNDGTVNCGTVTTPACDAEFRSVTVSGGGPYTLTFAPLSNGHALGEPIRIAATQLTTTRPNSIQVAIRHSSKLGATIAVYGAYCKIYSRTLLDSKSPLLANWTGETAFDTGDDCENNFGGPQIAIDEANGNIHVFKAITNANGATTPGIAYWLGTPDGAPMVSGIVNWSSRVVVDPTTAAGGPAYCVVQCNPPDIAGAVDSNGKVWVFWATNITGGAIKFATLVSPYTTASAVGTIATTGSNPRYPHVPGLAPLTRGYVPLFYQSGSGPYDIMLTTLDYMPPTVPTNVTATPTASSVDLTWTASTDNVGVTGYTVYRNGIQIATVSGATLAYSDTAIAGPNTYSYTVDAFDADGNHSAQSAPPAVVSIAACTGAKLFTTYFTWFDNASVGMLNDNIHLLNKGGSTSTGCVTLGAFSVPFSLTAGQATHVSFPAGSIGGPVVITVNSGPAVLASQRVQYYQSFNEVWAMSPAQAATTSYFNWFDKASPGMYNDNIHVVNPGTTAATGTVGLGSSSLPFSLAAGAETNVTFPAGTIGGPVIVTSTQPVLASQRVQYYQSFNEVVAMTAAQAAATSYFNWFDKASPGMFNDNVHIVNPGVAAATGTVSIPGGPSVAFSAAAGAETNVTFPAGTIGGPVIVTSTQPVLASQRVQYYQSFNEVAAASAAGASTASYFMWFDKASTGMFNDNIHLLNPGASSASVTVTLAGMTPVIVTVGMGQEVFVSVPSGAIGGPVTISSTQPVLASQRVQYYKTFNEVPSAS